jgi:HK97 family phage portal protein
MAFVLTSGQVQAVQSAPAQAHYPSSGMASSGSVRMAGNYALTYEQIWRSQPAVRTVVGFLARNIAQLGIMVYQRASDTDRVRLADHPLARLLEQPVPGSKWTRYRLIDRLVQDLAIFDEAYWLKFRNPVPALVRIPPRMITPGQSSWFEPDTYRLQGDRGYLDVAADQIVAFHGYNPSDSGRGVSPIETLRQILAEEWAAAGYREQLWRNGTRVQGYIERPKDAPKWSENGRDRFRRDWQAQYTGDGPEAGGTPILEDGMTFKGASVTPKDAQYVESRKLTREEVATAYHVPPVMVGMMEGATFSNVQELHRMLYQDALPPWLTQIAQDLETQLLPDLDPAGARSGTYVEFNIGEKLRGSFEAQAAALQSSVGGPWMTRGEARALNNLPEIADTDELIIPLNVITGGLASPRATDPNAQPAGMGQAAAAPAGKAIADVLDRFIDRQGRAVTSRTGAGVPDPFDTGRWRRELAADIAPYLAAREPLEE